MNLNLAPASPAYRSVEMASGLTVPPALVEGDRGCQGQREQLLPQQARSPHLGQARWKGSVGQGDRLGLKCGGCFGVCRHVE